MAVEKLSQIASGGAINPSTDVLVAVRGGNTDVLVSPGITSINGDTTAAQIIQSSGGSITVTEPSSGVINLEAVSGGAGTVTSVSVASTNGFAGTVANPTSTPAITLETTISGVLKGNGTAISAATAGTDYSAGTSGNATGIVKSTTTTGALTTAVAGDFPTLNQNTTGSAATLTTPRAINGVNFDGSAPITVAAAAGTLTGSTLAAGVTASSLTSFGANPVVGTQSSADNSTRAASTAYVTTAVTNALTGLDWKPAVGYATTANIVGTNTAGVFTYTSTGVDTIDGHQLALNDVVLFKNQVTGADNGVWVVTTAGAIGVAGILTRRSDYNTAADIHDGDTFFVQNGTVNGGTAWVQTDVVTTINSDPLAFSQVSGPGTYVAGTGLTLTGNSFSVNASQTQITGLGTLTSAIWQATKIGLAYGGTNADLSATGGTSNFLKQSSSGAAITVGQPAFTDISGAATTAQLPSNQTLRSVAVGFDGGGSALTSGKIVYLAAVPYSGTITAVTMLADQSGSAVVDIWKTNYAGGPPTVSNTITASDLPTLSSAQKSTDSTLTGWTTSVTAGDMLAFKLNSASTITELSLVLSITAS